MRSKPQITYVDDSRMTSCKYCYAEIHARARVCPLCSCNQTLFGAARGVIVASCSIVTALVSLGFAAFEKMEKLGLNTQLAGVMETLKLEEAKSEAATQAVEQLASDVPDDVLEEKYAQQFGEAPSAERLNEIEAKLSDDSGKKSLSKDEMIQLQKQKFWLRRMHGFGHGPGNGSHRPIQQSGYTMPQRSPQTAERTGPFYSKTDEAGTTADAQKTGPTDSRVEASSPRNRSSRTNASRRNSAEGTPTSKE